MPFKGMRSGEALLVIEILPLTPPTDVGANVAVRVAALLGDITVPLDTPLVLNPAPAAVTLEIVTFELPVFVNVIVLVLLVNSWTFAKFRLDGFAPSVGEVARRILIPLIIGLSASV